MFDNLPNDVYPRDTEKLPADGGSVHPYLENCAALYAAAHFGRKEKDGWINFFMPIVVCITKYRTKSKSGSFTSDYPLSTKNKPRFSKVIDDIIRKELTKKTVTSLLRKTKPALEALLRLQVVKYLVSVVFKGMTDVLVNLLKHRPSLGEPPAVPPSRSADPSDFYRDHYIAPISYSSRFYTDMDIAYFSNLRQQVHGTEKTLDKERLDPDDGGTLIFAFVPLSLSVPESPEKSRRSQSSIAQSPTSPSKCARGAMIIVDVNSSDSDDSE
jgi:hypothetical protein